jgi:hypothetical protein
MSKKISRFQTEDVKNTQKRHTRFRRPVPLPCKWFFDPGNLNDSKKNLEYQIMRYLKRKDKFHMHSIRSQDQDSFCLGYHF